MFQWFTWIGLFEKKYSEKEVSSIRNKYYTIVQENLSARFFMLTSEKFNIFGYNEVAFSIPKNDKIKEKNCQWESLWFPMVKLMSLEKL